MAHSAVILHRCSVVFGRRHMVDFPCAPVAQLDRAPDFGSGCRGFESLLACQRREARLVGGIIEHS